MIGTVNSGKSTLYNALLNSDYCNHKIRDVVCRATVSALPGKNSRCIITKISFRFICACQLFYIKFFLKYMYLV